VTFFDILLTENNHKFSILCCEIHLDYCAPIPRASRGISITQKGLKNTVLTESNRSYSTNQRSKVLTYIYIYVYIYIYIHIKSLSTLCICIIKSDSVQSLFLQRRRGVVSATAFSRTRRENSRKSGNEKVARGEGRTDQVSLKIELRTEWRKFLTCPPSPSQFFPPSSFANALLAPVLSSIGSAPSDLSPSFLTALTAPSRKYYLNCALVKNGS